MTLDVRKYGIEFIDPAISNGRWTICKTIHFDQSEWLSFRHTTADEYLLTPWHEDYWWKIKDLILTIY